MKVFRDITQCNLVVDQRFRGGASIFSVISALLEAVHTSETSVYYETTWCRILEGWHLHTHRSENLKPQPPRQP
jgi:hypothetical protein